jgi:hypothetical protein
MKPADDVVASAKPESPSQERDDLLLPLLSAPAGHDRLSTGSLAIGRLVALADGVPLVTFSGQPGTAAVSARSVVDLYGSHIGRDVVLGFEGGDIARPIVLGVMHGGHEWPFENKPASVEVVGDGQRLIVTARDQLVLRCGKASITLTKEGKVLIDGAYISSNSSGVVRLRGGSVQLN